VSYIPRNAYLAVAYSRWVTPYNVTQYASAFNTTAQDHRPFQLPCPEIAVPERAHRTHCLWARNPCEMKISIILTTSCPFRMYGCEGQEPLCAWLAWPLPAVGCASHVRAYWHMPIRASKRSSWSSLTLLARGDWRIFGVAHGMLSNDNIPRRVAHRLPNVYHLFTRASLP
jgi:hypothetical protein